MTLADELRFIAELRHRGWPPSDIMLALEGEQESRARRRRPNAAR
jgi:hypothetical protein